MSRFADFKEFFQHINVLKKFFSHKTIKYISFFAFLFFLTILSIRCSTLLWSFFPKYNKYFSIQKSKILESSNENYLENLLYSSVFPVSKEKLNQFKIEQKSNNERNSQSKLNDKNVEVVNKKENIDQEQHKSQRLNLTITGILASDNADLSQVIILYNNEENIYSEGDQLVGSSHRVFSIKENSIELITPQDDIELYEMVVDPNDRIFLLKTDNENFEEDSELIVEDDSTTNVENDIEYDEDINRNKIIDKEKGINISSIYDVMTISPVNDNGSIIGYRLNPGKKPELFSRYGFKSNDLAIAVNGFDLTDSTQVKNMFKELSSAKEFEVTVDREGILENIYISID